jgi:hypothetical protein
MTILWQHEHRMSEVAAADMEAEADAFPSACCDAPLEVTTPSHPSSSGATMVVSSVRRISCLVRAAACRASIVIRSSAVGIAGCPSDLREIQAEKGHVRSRLDEGPQ